MPVVGSLNAFSPPPNLGDLVRGPIHQGMGELGFVDGQNMVWEYRYQALRLKAHRCAAAGLDSGTAAERLASMPSTP